MFRYVCAGITYASGRYGYGADVHSDVCPPHCRPENMHREQWRKRIHTALDEWLDNSDGTGYFAIGGAEFWESLED